MQESLLKKIKKIKRTDSFLITVTILNTKREKLDTFLFVNNFPYEEFEGTKEAIIKLIGKTEEKGKNK